LKFVSTRAPFARPGPGATPFPGVVAPIGPSDVSPSSAAAVVSLAARPTPGRGASSEPAIGAPRCQWRVGDSWSGSPFGLNYPRKGEALPGHWVVLLERAAVSDPAERATTSPIPVAALLPSGHLIPWARGKTVSRLYSRGPRPRAPTHHPGTSLPPKQGSLPACRVGLWPGRFRTCWTTVRNFMNYRMVSILSDQPSLVAPSAGRTRR